MAYSTLGDFDSFTEHKFFRLGPDHLRGIAKIVKRRAPGLRLAYTVDHFESFFYETQDLEDLIASEEKEWRRISRLGIISEGPMISELGAVPNLQIAFKRDDRFGKIALTIDGSREFTDALSTELRSYLGSEVLHDRWPGKVGLIGIIGVAGALTMRWIIKQILSRPAPSAEGVLANPDLGPKLDYLIRLQNRPETPWPLLLSLFAAVLLTIMPIFNVLVFPESKLTQLFLSQDVFLFGAERRRYEHIRDLRGKLFWVVFIGCLVSLVAGLVVWQLTRRGYP